MGQVTAVGQVQAQQPLPRRHQRVQDRGVGLRARMRLHIGEVGAEQRLGPVAGDVLHHIDVLAAAVVAPAGQTLGVFVGQHAALRLQDRAWHEVLRGDHLQRVTLAAELLAEQLGDVGVDLGQRRSHCGGLDTGVWCGSHAAQSIGMWPRPNLTHAVGSERRRDHRFVQQPAESLDHARPGRPVVQPAAQQPVSLDIGAGVGAPQRRRQKPQHLLGAGVVDQQPAAQKARDLVGVAVFVVQHQRRVLAHCGQRRRRLGHRLGALTVESQPQVGVDLGGPASPVRADRRVQREVGQALGEQTLRGVHQEDGLLGVALAIDQPDLLTAVLGVVTRIGLVRHQPRQVRRQLLDVGIDGDRRAVIAEVVVEARPRLVGHHLVLNGFGVGKRILGADPVAQRAGERRDAFGQPLGRDFFAFAVRRHPVGQRTAATQRLVEPDMRPAVRLVVTLADTHVEVVVHLVDETDLLSGEFASPAFQRAQMRTHVVGALPIKPIAIRHIWQRIDQPAGLAHQVGRVGRGLGRHGVAQRRIAGEGVDVTRFDTVESQTEQQVLADQRGRFHDCLVYWPGFPPSHFVAGRYPQLLRSANGIVAAQPAGQRLFGRPSRPLRA